jgi:sarcosine/dimethylglycine N-methyltransferase
MHALSLRRTPRDQTYGCAMNKVSEHYAEGGPVAKVAAALDDAYPGGGPLTLQQLLGFDHFHTAGVAATARLGDLLDPGATDIVLDAGCGLGGPARYLADRFGCRVIGVDVTPDFIEIGRMLNERTGFTDRVDLRVGDITALDLGDGSVDHVWTQHVAMNIADRPRLYSETRRVMRAGGRFVLFDIIDGGGGELLLPVPWATAAEHSHLVTREELRALLEQAGFRIDVWEDPTEEMLAAMKSLMGPPPAGATAPPLTTALVINDPQTKGPRYMQNLAEGRTALALAMAVAV